MPFNRVHNAKAMLNWLLILNRKDNKPDEKTDQFSTKLVSCQTVPNYYPGLMLIPIPEAGFWLGYIDIGFWAAFLYVLGSLVYVVDNFFGWALLNPDYSDDAANPSTYLNTIASSIFVLNALACILDWWTQLMQIGGMNLMVSEQNTGGLVLSEIPHKISLYYFYNNFFFLGAAVVYLIQAIWFENPNTDLLNCVDRFWCGDFWINFWGSFLYFASSFYSVLEYYEYTRMREEDDLPALKFFTLNHRDLDWFGWGDFLFLATSVVAVVQVFITSFIDDSDDVYNALYLLENVLFLVDSLMYFIGYIQYMLELQSAMTTGMVDAQVTGAISALLDETNEEQDLLSPLHNFSTDGSSSKPEHKSSSFSAYFGWDEQVPHAPRSRHSFATDSDGKVRMEDLRNALSDARTHRIARRAEATRRLSLSDTPVGAGVSLGRASY